VYLQLSEPNRRQRGGLGVRGLAIGSCALS
jgi:hypothetical protein